MTQTPPRSPGRPKTGKTRMMSFRPLPGLRAEFEELADQEGRSYTDALIEAMQDWVRKKRREKDAGPDG